MSMNARSEYPMIQEGPGTDVMSAGMGGHCPRCYGQLYAPEIDPEKGTYEPGESTWWCPQCGWES